MTLSAADFKAFFHAIHCVERHSPCCGCIEPFVWQQQLVEQVLEGAWPQIIDVPTGLGKTAVVEVAVFALAAQARRPPDERTAPTRTFVVVDRRIIVDQTHELARLLQAKLDHPENDVLTEVAVRLNALSVGAAVPRPLEVVRMRGGLNWSWRWLTSPAQPAVITGTVDQYGSRLLFRGYGVGDRLRPIDAALTGTDRLLILDEAHLAWPFVQTVETVDANERRVTTAGQPGRGVLALRRPPPVLLSATPPADEERKVLRFDPTAETSEVARQRLAVQRRLHLVELNAKKENASQALAAALVAVAGQLVSSVERVAVICNTVSLARQTFAQLDERLGNQADKALLIGRCRETDREHISREWVHARLSPQDRPKGTRPLVVVATQTIEVGADIDVDALVTEAAPLDALLQRLGRLDRRGTRGQSDAFMVYVPDRHSGEEAVVYGAATQRTWVWLIEQAGVPKPVTLAKLASAVDAAPHVEMGPTQASSLLDPAALSQLASEPPLAPVVLGPTLAAWARTYPRPHPDQEIAPFLHGLDRGQPEVLVCWRAGLPSLDQADALSAWEAELRSAPVRSHETVSVPLTEARRFLAGLPAPGGADVEGQDPEDAAEDPGTLKIVAVAQASDGTVHSVAPREVRPGDVLVVDAAAGGHDAWGWTGRRNGHVVADVADLDLRRPRLRLRSEAIAGLLSAEPASLALPDAGDLDVDLRAVLDEIRSIADSAATSYAPQLAQVCASLAKSHREARVARKQRAWRVITSPPTGQAALPETVDDGDDDADEPSTSSFGSRPIDLADHLRDVEQRASHVAHHLGLPPSLVRAVARAGLAHDLGKADPRFQAMLYGGDPDRRDATGRLLAKSGMDPTDHEAFRRAARRSGLPRGLTHEAQSAALLSALIDAAPELADGLDVDLVLYLVASHHGRGRPLLPPVTETTGSASVKVPAQLPGSDVAVYAFSDRHLIDWDGPSRFQRLGSLYGWWGLALLETILRLADIAVSEEYAAQGDDQ